MEGSALSKAIPNPGSFRDPAGCVFEHGGRIFRTINPPADDFELLRESGLLRHLVDKGWLVGAEVVDAGILGAAASDARYVVEHPVVPFISYPYEWPFSALKAAAVHHLNVHLEALEFGMTLVDASAFNIQFIGPRPIFIDLLSFRRYQEGAYWLGYKQFCDQFLCPLLLRAYRGLPHNAWYRGSPEGIEAAELLSLLPWHRKLAPNVLLHLTLRNILQKSARKSSDRARKTVRKGSMPLAGLKGMLRGLRGWIERLQPGDRAPTTWEGYGQETSYTAEEAAARLALVKEFAARTRPARLWDIGCNTGEFSIAALESGAETVVGFDFDQGALERAFARARDANRPFLPLFMDMTNPTPAQGWAGRERASLAERANGNALIAMALLHHLAIGRNVPLENATAWLVSLAPRGLIEFVPKGDAQVGVMLANREDIFPGYHREGFEQALRSVARIERAETVAASGRTIFEYARER